MAVVTDGDNKRFYADIEIDGVSAFEGRILVFEGSQDRFWSIPR